jgi:ketosteroid isomerase-like protein
LASYPPPKLAQVALALWKILWGDWTTGGERAASCIAARVSVIGARRSSSEGANPREVDVGASGRECRAALAGELRRYSGAMTRTIVIAFIVFLAGCTRTTDEQRIREAMAAMQQAMEAGDPRAFMSHVTEDFVGNEAEFDRAALANLLRIEVLRNDSIGATLGPIGIEMQGDRAKAHVVATFTGGSGNLLPEHGSIYAITSSWKRQGSEWRCYSATWKQEL